MERYPPPHAASRSNRIPSGYGNYLGREDDSLPPRRGMGGSGGNSRISESTPMMHNRPNQLPPRTTNETPSENLQRRSAATSLSSATPTRLATALAERRAALQGGPSRRVSPLLSPPACVSQGYTPLLGTVPVTSSRKVTETQPPFVKTPKVVNHRPSPLVLSAVNPFSASFENRLAGDAVDAGGHGMSAGNSGKALLGTAQGGWEGGGGGGGDGSYGYGSRWDGGAGTGSAHVGLASLNRARSADDQVDDHGHAIYYKHGVRLVESADVRLETLTGLTTTIVFLVPYLCLALAIWLDLSGLDLLVRLYPPGSGVCNAVGHCSWHLDDVPALDRFMKLEGDFKVIEEVDLFPPSRDPSVLYYTLGVAVEMQGKTEKGWEVMYRCAAPDNIRTVHCSRVEGTCETVSLTYIIFDLPEMQGRYDEYSLDVNLTIIKDLNGTAGPWVSEITSGAVFRISTESEVYATAKKMTRLPLLGISAFLIVLWLAMGCCGEDSLRNPSSHSFYDLAERRYIMVMLIGLLVWQNPLMAAVEWLPVMPAWMQLGSDLCNYLGMQLVWLCWVCLMDGQHFFRQRHRLGSRDGQQGYRDSPQTVYRDHHANGRGQSFLKGEGVLPHHPHSDSFLDFIVPKVLYTLVAMGVGVSLAIVHHPNALPMEEGSLWGLWLVGRRMQQVCAVLTALTRVLIFDWAVYFLRVTIKTARILRGQPFMATRRQQLSYRLMAMQGSLAALLLGLGFGAQLYSVVRYLATHSFNNASARMWMDAIMDETDVCSTWARGFRTPLGQMLFMSAVCYNLVYVLLPPPHSVRRKHDRMYINMERDMPPREIARRYADGRKALTPLFCLETACTLMETAWQAYYDPHNPNLQDPVAPGKQDLSYLGLKLVDFFYDESKETKIILCRGADRLVLAFRGTANISNIITDLKLTQTPLPDLRPDRNPVYVGVAGKGAGGGGRMHVVSSRGGSAGGDFYHSPASMPPGCHEGGSRKHRGGSGARDDVWASDGGSMEGGRSSQEVEFGEDEGSAEGRRRSGSFDIGPSDDDPFGLAFRRCLKAVLNRIPLANQALPRVHSGFWEAYSAIREEVLSALAAELKRDYRPVYLTGHSLGGALATLAAYDIQKNFVLPDQITLYTFGSPMVGNPVFSRKHSARVPHHFRVVNDGDFISSVPQFFGTYRHTGCKVVIDSEKYGTLIVEPTMVENTFGAKAPTSISVHLLTNYRVCLEACLEEPDFHDYVARGFSLSSGHNKVDLKDVPDWLKSSRRKQRDDDPW